jgi:hypothetical protein
MSHSKVDVDIMAWSYLEFFQTGKADNVRFILHFGEDYRLQVVSGRLFRIVLLRTT